MTPDRVQVTGVDSPAVKNEVTEFDTEGKPLPAKKIEKPPRVTAQSAMAAIAQEMEEEEEAIKQHIASLK